MTDQIDRTILDEVNAHQRELAKAHAAEPYLKRTVRRTDKMFAQGIVNTVREARRNRPKDKPAPRPRRPRRGFGK